MARWEAYQETASRVMIVRVRHSKEEDF